MAQKNEMMARTIPKEVKEWKWWSKVREQYFNKIKDHADGYAKACYAPDIERLRKIRIFDTTERDGMQMPDAFYTEEMGIPIMQNKIDIAIEMARWGIPMIEVGTAISSDAELEAIRTAKRRISGEGLDTKVVSLATIKEAAVEKAKQSEADIIHVFSSGSVAQAFVKFGKKPEELVQDIERIVRISYKADFQEIVVSLEAAAQADPDHLVEVAKRIKDAGREKVQYNIPDTNGVSDPIYIFALIKHIQSKVEIPFHIHCHNDRGRALENTMAAIYAGVDTAHVTMHGMGERAGNTALEQLLINMYTQHRISLVDMKKISGMSKFIAERAGIKPPVNAPVVGKNAFWHESGVHGDAVYKSQACGYTRRTGIDGGSVYAPYNPKHVGREEEVGIGHTCGRKNVMYRLRKYGIEIPDEMTQQIVEKIKKTSVNKKISDADFILMAYETITGRNCDRIKVADMQVHSGSGTPHAYMKIEVEGQTREGHGIGNGPVDAGVNAIKDALGKNGIEIDYYETKSIGKGSSAGARSNIVMVKNGTGIETTYVDTNTTNAGIYAYVKGLNALHAVEELRKVETSQLA